MNSVSAPWSRERERRVQRWWQNKVLHQNGHLQTGSREVIIIIIIIRQAKMATQLPAQPGFTLLFLSGSIQFR